MQKVSRQVLKEVIWLTVSIGLTFLLSLIVFGKSLLGGTIDIHLHDTFFVIPSFHILFPFFLLVTFLIYFLKEFRNSFQRTIPNWILIVIGFTLVITMTFLIKLFSSFSLETSGGWTLYPPLSSLGSDKLPEFTQDPATKFTTTLFLIIQVIVLALLLFAIFRAGQQKQAKK